MMEREIIIVGSPLETIFFLKATFQEIDLNIELPSGLYLFHFGGIKKDYEHYVKTGDGSLPPLLKSTPLIYSVVRDPDEKDLFSFILRWLPSKETKISLIKLLAYDHTNAIWKEVINQAYKLGFIDRMPSFENSEGPWKDIPDIGWDRQALKLWWEDLTSVEIGNKLQRKPQTILNKIWELRRLHGEKLVPKRRSSKIFD